LSVPHQIVQESSHDSVLSSSLLAVSRWILLLSASSRLTSLFSGRILD
jgi:hypothetical protein